MMKRILSVYCVPIVGAVLLGVGSATAFANELEDLRLLREEKVRMLNKEYMAFLEELKTRYLEADSLEKGLEVQKEIQKFAEKVDPDVEVHENSEIARLRNIRNRQVIAINQSYTVALQELGKKLTQSGNLELAVQVKRELEKYSPSGRGQRTKSAEVEIDGRFGIFKNGELKQTNRNYKWEGVPRRYSDKKVLLRPGGGGLSQLEFSVVSPGVVQIVIHKDDLEWFLDHNWEKGDDVSNGKKALFVMEKWLPIGRYSLQSSAFFKVTIVLSGKQK